MSKELLNIKNLKTTFRSRGASVHAVRGVSLTVSRGEVLGIVGESGSGKSVLMKSVMGLLPENAAAEAEQIVFEGKDLQGISRQEYRNLRGRDMTMIFQDPMTALNPLKKVGYHIEEVLRRHGACSRKEAAEGAVRILEQVGITSPEKRVCQYPHELSGGMRQRVLIGMALSCEPKLLIADEPTTALDVTIQAQILDLLKELQHQKDLAVVFITHDMGVVADICTRVMVMYGGLIMEEGRTEEIFYEPRHPYTQALLKAIPALDIAEGERLNYIDGLPPSLADPPPGCPFAERCEYSRAACVQEIPVLRSCSETHKVRCILAEPGGEVV